MFCGTVVGRLVSLTPCPVLVTKKKFEGEIKREQFLLPTPLQILEEEKYLLENMKGFETYYWGDHGNNVVPMKGMLPQYQEQFLKNIAHTIATHPVCREEVLQTFAW